MSRALGRDHDDIDARGRNDGLEVNAETMRDTQNLSRNQIGSDLAFVQLALGLVRREDMDPISALSGLGRRNHREPIGTRLGCRGTVWVKPDNDFVAAIAQVLGLGVSL